MAASRRDRMLTSSVLVLESVVVLLAIPMAIVVGGYPAGVGWALGGLALACAVLPGAAGRAWFLPVGWMLQVAVVASGLLVPLMFALGLIFTGLWFTATRLQSKPGPAVSGG